MAIVLVAVGAFLYLRLGASLDETIDGSLQARAAEIAPGIAAGNTDLAQSASSGLVDPEERFVQILDPRGRVVDETPPAKAPVLRGTSLAEATRRVTWLELEHVRGIEGRARALAAPLAGPDGTEVVIVGASLQDRDETIHGFVIALVAVGAAALALASLLGYALATAALRPVESMRAEAAVVSADEPERRLPLARSNDEIRRLGETLNAMLTRLSSALARERTFVADASHELRTPLALLKTELELALRRPRSDEELRDALRAAAAETDRLVKLADELLLLTRSDQGQLYVERTPVSARELVGDVAERFTSRVRGAGRTIAAEAPDHLVLAGDPDRLAQALTMLVENALVHGSGAIRLEGVASDGRAELHVLDDGPGFPADFIDRAFDRFSRADPARSRGGTGLGLTISAAIAAAHGGAAHATNRVGGGADVWISIPLSGVG
jgi:signal transduction histidine kinase